MSVDWWILPELKENIYTWKLAKALAQPMHLKQEMDLNVEGIETITYLFQRITDMQLHIVRTTNRLWLYESVKNCC